MMSRSLLYHKGIDEGIGTYVTDYIVSLLELCFLIIFIKNGRFCISLNMSNIKGVVNQVACLQFLLNCLGWLAGGIVHQFFAHSDDFPNTPVGYTIFWRIVIITGVIVYMLYIALLYVLHKCEPISEKKNSNSNTSKISNPGHTSGDSQVGMVGMVSNSVSTRDVDVAVDVGIDDNYNQHGDGYDGSDGYLYDISYTTLVKNRMSKKEKYVCLVYLIFCFILCILGGIMATVSLLALIQLIVFLSILIFVIRKICQNKNNNNNNDNNNNKSMKKACGESYLYQRYLILLVVAQMFSTIFFVLFQNKCNKEESYLSDGECPFNEDFNQNAILHLLLIIPACCRFMAIWNVKIKKIKELDVNPQQFESIQAATVASKTQA